jgi:hypothetical protein
MWLCTKHGFFSIVQKGHTEFHIRARVRGDLENLKKLAGIKRRIIVTEDADYRYRMVGIQADVFLALTALAGSINYTNFKSMIEGTEDQRDKLDAYHEIWRVMAGVQRRKGR